MSMYMPKTKQTNRSFFLYSCYRPLQLQILLLLIISTTEYSSVLPYSENVHKTPNSNSCYDYLSGINPPACNNPKDLSKDLF